MKTKYGKQWLNVEINKCLLIRADKVKHQLIIKQDSILKNIFAEIKSILRL